MGADEGDAVSALEQPAHSVETDAFWLGQTEVTNAQYGLCVAAGACTPPGNPRWQDAAAAEQPNIEYHAVADRAPMDVSRIAADAGFVPRFGPREAAEDFVSWIGLHPGYVAALTMPQVSGATQGTAPRRVT